MHKYLLTTIFLLFSLYCLTQGFPSAGGGEPCGGPFAPPCPVPLDGGIGLLIAAGAAFGYKSLKNKRD